jgi:hypothetical protein
LWCGPSPAAAAKAALNAQPLTAADRLGSPDADLATRRRVEGGVDYATMTWRLGENAEGRVSLELLSARLGPGAYDPEDETTTVRHRAPEADFAKGAARFSYDLKEVNTAAAAEGGGGGVFAADLEGDRVWLDVQGAVAATRPNVNVGGKINPEPTCDEDAREPLPYLDALYDVEKGLEFLRNGNYTTVPDFASAFNPRSDANNDADVNGERRSAEFGPSGRNPAAPDFYDVGTDAALGATAYPRGAGGAVAWGAPHFAKAPGRGDAFYMDAAALRSHAPGFAAGDRLDLDPTAVGRVACRVEGCPLASPVS